WAGAFILCSSITAFGARPQRMPKGYEEALNSGRSEEVWQKGTPEARQQRLAEIRKLADKGDMRAQFVIGFIADRGTNYTMAVYWYLKAAEKGSSVAQYALGYLYL